ncbi:hypothetical protein BDW59DRAFT_59980 [Aspergillus cavernicola]|uniref:Uncharacterized protein n=1 Tax=Aspergillus cavernicola TaxID=176166 RepID=A0ABR4IH20_9EURO
MVEGLKTQAKEGYALTAPDSQSQTSVGRNLAAPPQKRPAQFWMANVASIEPIKFCAGWLRIRSLLPGGWVIGCVSLPHFYRVRPSARCNCSIVW